MQTMPAKELIKILQELGPNEDVQWVPTWIQVFCHTCHTPLCPDENWYDTRDEDICNDCLEVRREGKRQQKKLERKVMANKPDPEAWRDIPKHYGDKK